MKSVLISIQPKWCELIASGKKTVEVRKTKPNLSTPFKCYIYCTKGFKPNTPYSYKTWAGYGKVIGEFVCDTIITDKTFGHDDLFKAAACMSDAEIAAYCVNPKMYGWYISDLVIYDEPRDLKNYQQCFKCEFRQSCVEGAECYDAEGWYALSRPPQSWCYVEVLR